MQKETLLRIISTTSDTRQRPTFPRPGTLRHSEQQSFSQTPRVQRRLPVRNKQVDTGGQRTGHTWSR